MAYDLGALGWKAFQDLCCAVAAEVLKRPVQTFLGSRDGGRDAAFLGTWDGPEGTKKSTIQIKYVGGSDPRLTLGRLSEELAKAQALAAEGLADDYVIITNAGVSGEAEREICAAFVARGVKTCRVFHGGWIVERIKESARLRMLVPRIYGIGDLSQIIAAHAYDQARAILADMGEDLGCFVPTASYRAAVDALHAHRFVILLGDPASGKSTIAALLALGSLDEGCPGAVRITDPNQLHLWHPGEKQVLWVDDAFGANQFDVARMNRWNAELGLIRTAIHRGARVIMNSRNYIWAAARPHLRIRDLPLLTESQVVIDVQALTSEEREQMLYNHVRRKQPLAMRARLKPYLPAVAANRGFLPETARRLGDPFFTKRLEITAGRLRQLVEHPVEFLVEVLEGLDDACRAAIALIFLHPASGVPSPIPSGPELETVVRLTGRSAAEIARALEFMDDSLTRRVAGEDGDRWTFRHPTISDAFASIVAASPELVEIYVGGAKTERLIREVVCSAAPVQGASIRIPTALYSRVQSRLADVPLEEDLRSFLGQRCDDEFLRSFVEPRRDVLAWAEDQPVYSSAGAQLLIAALHRAGLLSEGRRLQFVRSVGEDAITWCNAELFENLPMRSLFAPSEWSNFEGAYRDEWLANLDQTFDKFRYSISCDDELGLFSDFKESMEKAERHYSNPAWTKGFAVVYRQIDEYIESLPQADEPSYSTVRSQETQPQAQRDTDIFDDIDAPD